MADTGKISGLKRTIFVVFALVTLLSISLSFYYLIYTPKQLSFYNKSCFRVLEEIVDNFKSRLKGYSDASYPHIKNETIANVPAYGKNKKGSSINNFSLIIGIPDTFKQIRNDTTDEFFYLDTLMQNEKMHTDLTLATIFEPIINIHRSTFESVMLVEVDSAPKGKILYNSSLPSIDKKVNMDTLYKKTLFTSPVILDLTIESVDYKLFLYPFQIHNHPFAMGAFISNHDYKANAQTFPVFSLLILTIIILILLMSLPFLKIFHIGQQESITVRDLTSIITMTYILPFFFAILIFTAWLKYFIDEKSTNVTRLLHREALSGFYNEIDSCITQLKLYDSIIQGDSSPIAKKGNPELNANTFFHPVHYKNMDQVFWLDINGDERIKWELRKLRPVLFNQKSRQYFIDIKNNAGYKLPGVAGADTFSMQSTLSKTTGDYNINIVMHSHAKIDTVKAAVIGLSGKMYSVFKPVLPRGSDFCIINAGGDILYHSQSERSLQENIFKEVSDSGILRLAVSHKDSVLIDDIKLYDKNVKMIISPVNGLPYFLISYTDKRPDLLYIFHIMGFSILCELLLLLTIALLTLYFHYSYRQSSLLFFSYHQLDFIKPSTLKTAFYKKILDYLIYTLLAVILISFCFRGINWMFFILNISILLPFFSVIGYYLIRCIENNTHILTGRKISRQRKIKWVKSLFSQSLFRKNIISILIPYVIIIILYHLVKAAVIDTEKYPAKGIINIVLLLLEIGFPFFAVLISLFEFPSIAGIFSGRNSRGKSTYLSYFVLSVILSGILTGMVPAIGFMLHAAELEKGLQLKARQINLAGEIQQHREYINKKVSLTNLVTDSNDKIFYPPDHLYIDSLKFSGSKGLYLLNNRISTEEIWDTGGQSAIKDSSFYKMITKFLFLPRDHPDFFDNTKDYYYWKTTNSQDSSGIDTISLHYKNTTDYNDPLHIIISIPVTSLFSPSRFFNYRKSVLLVICTILFVLVLYRILSAVSKRIFLLGYFDNSPGREHDNDYLNNTFFKETQITGAFEKSFWNASHLTTELIKEKEKKWSKETKQRQHEECVIKIVSLLAKTYENIWQSLTPDEKFVLYDFALDGFTNYKNIDVWYSLYKKGLVIKVERNFKIFNDSFRNFIVSKKGTVEIIILRKTISEGGVWGNLRTAFYILLFVGIVFLFITQEDVSKTVLAIVTALGTLIPLIVKLFDSSPSTSSSTGDSSNNK